MSHQPPRLPALSAGNASLLRSLPSERGFELAMGAGQMALWLWYVCS
jgi:hypothetical protein